MKSILQQLAGKNKEQERAANDAAYAEIANPLTKDSRRNFLKKTVLGGMGLGAFMFSSVEDTVAQSTSKVSRSSNPSDLKITDMRYCVLELAKDGSRNPLIRIDTNQGYLWLGGSERLG